MKLTESRTTKISLIVGLLLSIILIGYIRNIGYESREISFYDNLLFFPHFIFGIGVVFLLLNETNNQILKNQRSIIYFISIYYLLFNIILISLFWYLKYDFFFGSDSWLHLLSMKNIMNSSHVNLASNFYPVVAIYVSEFSALTGVPLESVYIYVMVIQNVACGLIMYILIKTISSYYDTTLPIGTTLLIILINPIFFMGARFAPWTFSFLFLTIYIYSLAKYYDTRSISFKILTVVSIVLLITTHMISATFILSSLILMYILFNISNHISNEHFVSRNHIILFGVLLLTWIFIATGFADNQLSYVLQKLPEILLGDSTTAQQTTITNKSFTDLLLSRSNIVSNTFLVLISITLIFSDIIKQKRSDKNIIVLLIHMNYIFAGFVLYFISQFILGQTDYSGTQMRYIYYSSITFPIFIYYSYIKLTTYIPTRVLSTILLIIFLISAMTIYPRPELADYSPLIPTSTYSGIDWGNENIISDYVKIITGMDYISQYMVYNIGSSIYPSMYASTNGLLTYFDYNVKEYKHRQYEQKFNLGDATSSYLYYYPLMDEYVAYSKYDNSIIGINYQSIDEKKDDMMYNSGGFIIFKLDEAWNKNQSTL